MAPPARIQVLLAVYNGARYLEAALESLCAQDFQDWSVLVRDDGSQDGTQAMLEKWQNRLGTRLQILPNPENINLGMNKNYSRLLAASTAPYITVISHDDTYRPNKLSLTLAAMEKREAEVGTNRPILVYTDQVVVNERMEVLAASHWKHVGWHPPKRSPLGRLLVHSAICGGTCLMNRALIRLLGERPLCEDVWIALVAAAFGDLVPLAAQTVNFRWHTSNQSKQVVLGALVRRVIAAPLSASEILHSQLDSLRPRARLFLERYRDRLTQEQIATLQAFLRLPDMGTFARRRAVLRYGLLYASWIRTIGLLVLV